MLACLKNIQSYHWRLHDQGAHIESSKDKSIVEDKELWYHPQHPVLSGSLTNPEAMETIPQSERASLVPDLDLDN